MSEVTKDSITISNLYKSRKILLEQLQSRGFNTADYMDFSISEIYILYKNDQLNMYLSNSEGSSVFVKYSITKNLNNSVINEDIEFLYNAEKKLKPSDQLIYIIKGEPNDTMMNVLREVYIQQSIFITIYNLERLLFNILEHTMIPKHNILSEVDKQYVMKEYNIKSHREFPEISRFDPVAIAIGLRPRQLCEILRPSKTTIYTKYYRICVQ